MGSLQKTRNKVYLIITWLLIGAVIFYAAFFSSINGFRRIAFSIPDNDIYEINSTHIAAGTIAGDHYGVLFPISFAHQKLNYLRVEADGITNDKTALTFYGGNFDDNGEFVVNFRILGVDLNNGVNYYELSEDDYSCAAVIVDGEENIVIKSVQFRESQTTYNYKRALLAASIALFLFLIITEGIWKSFAQKKNRIADFQ